MGSQINTNNNQDPDKNFINAFNEIIKVPEESSRNLNNFDKSSFSMLHLNVRILQKNFENLFNLLMTLKFEFKVICITQTWYSDNSMNHNIFEVPQYKSIHQVRRTGKGGSVAAFPHESLTFSIRHDLSVNNADIEALCVAIVNKKSKSIFINTQYRQPARNFKEFEAYLKIFLAKSKTTDKTCFLVGDLNLSLIDYQSNTKVRNFVNSIFTQHSLNKPTVTKTTQH